MARRAPRRPRRSLVGHLQEQREAFPRSVKRGVLEWIMLAKRAPTRAKRIEETAERAARGERANQWRPA